MTYQPLHHKYRPQTFADLVGQQAIATTLTHALDQERIAPAYLFTGPRGTGKTSSARILAKSLNCLQSPRPTAQPCGSCEVCRAIANGSALDVIEIDAASNTGVDNIRELIDRAQFAPVQCRYKVYVIDECHMLSTSAFNALLKTLEEPPDRVVFILATTDPQRVLPTIISRCQRFDFRRIPLQEMVQHLRAIATQESIQIAEDALNLVGQLAQGGLRDAESLLDQLSLLAGQITIAHVWDLAGAVPEQDLFQLVQAIAADQPAIVIEQARNLMERGREPLVVLQNLASFYRDLLIAKTAPSRNDLAVLSPAIWEQVCDFAAGMNLTILLTGQQHLRTCELQVKNTTQPRLWFEVALMGLLPSNLEQPPVPAPVTISPSSSVSPPAQPTTIITPSIPPAQPAVAPTAKTSPPITTTPTGTAAPHPQPPVVPVPSNAAPTPTPVAPPQPVPITSSSQDLHSLWQNVVKEIQPTSAKELLRQMCCLKSFNGREALIAINGQPWLKTVQDKSSNIEDAFQKTFQKNIKIRLEVSSASFDSSAVANAHQSPMGNRPPRSSGSSPPDIATRQNPIQTTKPETRAISLEIPRENPSVINNASSSISSQPPPNYWQEPDSLTKAAQSFARMFNGVIIDLEAGEASVTPAVDLENLAPVISSTTPTLEETDELESASEEELPF